MGTTGGFGRLRRVDTGSVLVTAAFAIWATATITAWFAPAGMPGGLLIPGLLAFGVPPVLGGLAQRRSQHAAFVVVAGAAWAVPMGLLFARFVHVSPKVAYALPVVALAGMFASRFPRACMAGLVVIAGAYGTIDAYTGYHSLSVADLLLAALWISIVGRILFGRRTLPIRLSPALFLLGAYMALTIVLVFATSPLSQGIRGFRLSTFHLSALIVIGYGAFQARTLKGLARAVAVICLFVGAYATLRWVIGPSAKERAVNQSSDFFRIYNQTTGGDAKVQGSLPNGQQLGVWMSCAIPFLVAMALAWRGRFQIVVLAALPVSLIGLLGSGQRTAIAAVIAGCLTILVVHIVSRGFPGPRLGVALATAVALIAAATVVYPAVVNNPDKRQRYANLLTPGEDLPFQERLFKWRQVLSDLKGHPFGFGIGTGDAAAIPRRFVDQANYNIDNSYLMLAWDQGLIMMGFFIVTLLVLLVELLRHAVWTRGPSAAAFATAAAGTLVSMLVEMMGSTHIDSPAIIAGWVIVGLGVAQYGSRRAPKGAAAPAVV
jgi:hypothetical protein